jgi:hypothetical protein
VKSPLVYPEEVHLIQKVFSVEKTAPLHPAGLHPADTGDEGRTRTIPYAKTSTSSDRTDDGRGCRSSDRCIVVWMVATAETRLR